jgi:hypothetical protein
MNNYFTPSKNFVLSVLFFSLIGCTRTEYQPISWLNSQSDSEQTQRIPASTQAACFIDAFDIEEIKKENADLEKQWKSKEKISDKFNFAKFKAAETHYIKLFEKYITLNDMAKKCSDLPCVLNAAYGKSDGEEGHRIYNWFLNMGSGISTAREIPSFADDANKELKSYLFPNEELKLLNMASKTISTRYRKILVSTIHRFPDGTAPGPMTAGQYNPYWYYWGPRDNPTSVDKQPSTIFLTKQEIRFDNREQLIRGHYNHTLIHELTHALDFSNGPVKSRKDFSDLDAWALLSWKWAEVTRIETQVVNGKERQVEVTEMKWQVDPTKKDGFLRSYQSTSPSEDFADSGANYIIDPEGMLRVSPNKYKVFKEKFYFDQGTTKNDFIANEAKKIASFVESRVWEIVKACLVDKKIIDNQPQQKVKFTGASYIDKNARNCLESLLYDDLHLHIQKLKRENYHACHYLKSSEVLLNDQIMLLLSKSLNDAINRIDEYKLHQAKWVEFRSSLKNNCDPVHIFLSVQQSSRPMEQYQTKFTTCIESHYQPYVGYGEIIAEEKEIYKQSYDYERVSRETAQQFEQLMRGFETQLVKGAKTLLQQCSVVKEEPLLSTNAIYGGNVFVNASVLNCLNESYGAALSENIQKFLKEKYKLNQDVIYYLGQSNQAAFIELIHRELAQINLDEQKKYLVVFDNITSELENQYKNDQQWQKKLLEQGDIALFCQKDLSVYTSQVVQKNWTKVGYPLTLSLAETRNLAIDKVCPSLIKEAQKNLQAELGKVDKEINLVVTKFLKEPQAWIESIDHEQNFYNSCQEHLATTATQSAIIIYAKSASAFLSEGKIVDEILSKTCSQMTTSFHKQIEDLKKQSSQYELEITSFLSKDLNWQISYNESDYLKNCQLEVQKNFKAMSTLVKHGHNANLVSGPLQVKFLAISSCQKQFQNWRKVDLEILLKFLQQKTLSFKTYIQSQKQSQTWQNYMINFNEQIEIQVTQYLHEKFEPTKSTCLEKFPYVRFATMKMNRKKCLEAFFTKNSKSSLWPMEGLERVQAEQLFKYFELVLHNEYEKLHKNLDIFLQ